MAVSFVILGLGTLLFVFWTLVVDGSLNDPFMALATLGAFVGFGSLWALYTARPRNKRAR